jgi:CheY-like chemotaxis protein
MLPHVFELFMQERQALDRAPGGLGLGLAIVQNLMKMHGGTVSVTSGGHGAGSSFTIRLPSATSAGERPGDTPDERGLTEQTLNPLRVLIVDDNADAGESLAMVLNELGCDTRVACDGPSALALAATFRPELALLDIGLPMMDGYELARQLRRRPESARLRLIALTGYGGKGDIELAMEAGFDEHLVKPIDFEDMELLLARATEGGGSR